MLFLRKIIDRWIVTNLMALFLITPFVTFSQYEKKIDQINKLLQKPQPPDSAMKLLFSLGYYYMSTNMDSSLIYTKAAADLAGKAKDENLKGSAFLIYGTVLSEVGHYEESIKQLKKGEQCFLNTDNKLMLGNLYNNLGRAYNVLGKYNIAIDNYFKAITSYENAGNRNGAFNSKMNVIATYATVKEYSKAQKMCEDILQEVLKMKSDSLTGSLYEKMGAIYLFTDTSKALVYYEKALPLREKMGRKESVVYLKLSIGEIYLEKFKKTKNEGYFLNARREFLEAIDICDKYRIGLYFSASYQVLSSLYMSKNNSDSAIYFANKALVKSEELNTPLDLVRCYQILYLSYETKKNTDSAFYYLKKLVQVQDTLSNNEIKKKLMGSEMDYTVEKNNAENKAKIAVKNSIIVGISSLVLMILLLVAFLYMRYQREKQKQFSLLLIHSQEEERKRISKELHDGIGQNLLMIKLECGMNTPLVEVTINELRTISRNLHPVQLEKLGFKKAIESIVEDAERMSKVFFSHEIEDVDEFLDGNQKINLYRMVQECISNIIKHSGAKDARVTILRSGKKVISTIYDNGNGFDLSEAKRKKSLGLTSLSERAGLMNGAITIVTGTKGTKIEIKTEHG